MVKAPFVPAAFNYSSHSGAKAKEKGDDGYASFSDISFTSNMGMNINAVMRKRRVKLRVTLINMPFGCLAMPSLALTQLYSVLTSRFQDSVELETLYLNLDFARDVGDVALYDYALSGTGMMTGFGDWFFRQAAFPSAADNTADYLGRFYFDDEDPRTQQVRRFVETERPGVNAILDRMIDRYRLAEADIVGFTALFSQTVASLAMAKRLKRRNPDIITVIGGAACEGVMGQTLARNIESIDYVFSGPALVSFPEFVQNCMQAKREDNDFIDGVFSKKNQSGKGGGAVGLSGETLDINANVLLDYRPFLESLDKAFPGRDVRPILLFETSRGCRWAEKLPCSFCGLNGLQRTCQALSPEHAIRQIESLSEWAPRSTVFIAVDTLMPENYIKEVLPALRLPAGMRLRYEVRSVLSEADINVLCKAGVSLIQPGVEALSTVSLKLMKKGTTAFGNINFLKYCARHPIKLEWNLLVGSPGENESVYEKYLCDFPLLMHLPPPSAAYPVNLVRYSHYHENPAAYGLDLQPQDYYGLTFPFDVESLRCVACVFVDRNSDAERMDHWLEQLNRAIAVWRTRWARSDGKLEPRLCLRCHEGCWTVYDSRKGVATEYKIGSLAREILESVDCRAAGVKELEKRCAKGVRGNVAETLAWLKVRGLVFEEDRRFLSLVDI